MNCEEHNRNRKGSASVLASRWQLCGARKRDLTEKTKTHVYDGSVPERYLLSFINHLAGGLISITVSVRATTISQQKSDVMFAKMIRLL